MENIKSYLLKNLDDITQKMDYNECNDQHITLNSTFIDENNSSTYELSVELCVVTKDVRLPGNYQHDRGDTEGSGTYYDISDIDILNIYIFKDGSDTDLLITKEEILNQINY